MRKLCFIERSLQFSEFVHKSLGEFQFPFSSVSLLFGTLFFPHRRPYPYPPRFPSLSLSLSLPSMRQQVDWLQTAAERRALARARGRRRGRCAAAARRLGQAALAAPGGQATLARGRWRVCGHGTAGVQGWSAQARAREELR
jgi:hypothetical protein